PRPQTDADNQSQIIQHYPLAGGMTACSKHWIKHVVREERAALRKAQERKRVQIPLVNRMGHDRCHVERRGSIEQPDDQGGNERSPPNDPSHALLQNEPASLLFIGWIEHFIHLMQEPAILPARPPQAAKRKGFAHQEDIGAW